MTVTAPGGISKIFINGHDPWQLQTGSFDSFRTELGRYSINLEQFVANNSTYPSSKVSCQTVLSSKNFFMGDTHDSYIKRKIDKDVGP